MEHMCIYIHRPLIVEVPDIVCTIRPALSDIRTDIEAASAMMSTINVDSLWSYKSAIQHIFADIVQTEIADTVHRANGYCDEGRLFMCLPQTLPLSLATSFSTSHYHTG